MTKPQFSTKFRTGSEPNEPFSVVNCERVTDVSFAKNNLQNRRNESNNNGTTTTTTSTPTSGTNEGGPKFPERGSFKLTAKKSFRKMTFRPKLTEACGTVWLNARRPSIRSELKMLNAKTAKTSSNNFFYHHHQSVDQKILMNSNYQRNGSVGQIFVQKFRKFFACFQKSQLNSISKDAH